MNAFAFAPSAWQEAVIERVVPRTARVVSVFLHVALPVPRAGQHVDVRLTAEDGYSAQRSYSIASAPDDPGIELLIERLDDGEVSPYFHDVAAPGDRIDVRGPIGGHFVWTPEDGGPLLLVAGGSGIAPLMSMVRQATSNASMPPTLLLYSARTWDELVFRDALLALAQRHAEFDVAITTTRAPPPDARHGATRIDAAFVRERLAAFGHRPRTAYVCGSNRFVEAVTQALVENDVDPMRIRTERYGGMP